MSKLLIKSLGILPQNAMSLSLGALTRVRWPKSIKGVVHRAFVHGFGIDLSEAEKERPEDFDSIEDIFVRSIKESTRPIATPLCSPSDGKLVISQRIVAGKALQAKGIDYSAEELVFGANKTRSKDFDPNWFTTVYLAPHNYHRVHTPAQGMVESIRYIHGRLWPVNEPAVRSIPGLFCRNERLVFCLNLDEGRGRIWIVMVGAMNVGRMTSTLDESIVTNAEYRMGSDSKPLEVLPMKHVKCGDEIGTFMLGSTVVLIYDKRAADSLKPREVATAQVIKMGESLF